MSINIIDQKLLNIIGKTIFSTDLPDKNTVSNTFSNIKNLPLNIIRDYIKKNPDISNSFIILIKSLLLISLINDTDYTSPFVLFTESILACPEINIEDLNNRFNLSKSPNYYGNITSILLKNTKSIIEIENNQNFGILPIFIQLPIIIYGYNSPEWTLTSVQSISYIIYNDDIIAAMTVTITEFFKKPRKLKRSSGLI